MLRIKSVGKPFVTPSLAFKGATTLARADAMGLFPEREVTVALDASTFRRLAERLRRAGIGGAVVPMLTSQTLVAESKVLEQYLDQLTEALEASPVPASEWKQLMRVLGIDMLERLLGASAQSIRRYARTIRNTPDDVAGRLHWVALIVGDLASAYNEIGIRQWFDRKRVQLDGRTPAQLLTGDWKPDDPGPQQVRSLAHSLAASPAT